VRDVHKAPPLDIVGWYALVPKTGPTSDHLPIHNEILERYNESAILLGFHIEDVLHPVPGNPMPITIYESVFEAEDASKDSHTEGEDKEMKDLDAAPKMVLRFRELTYGTETGEAEMIAMQDIREGVAFSTRSTRNSNSKTTMLDIKGKGKATATSQAASDEDANLTKDELEQISAFQTKANATKMMLDRINLLVAYLEQLPPDFVSGTEYPGPGGAESPTTGEYSTPSAKILRQIQALVTNIELVTPAQQEALEEEMLQEANDVKVVELMADLMASISAMREVGKKFAVVEASKQKPRLPERQFEYGPGGSSSQLAPLGNVGDIAM
jgi:COP9 signalosome complex subunit 6